jgi:hypothetical protein
VIIPTIKSYASNRATAEAICLKWPTSVKDHDNSEVAVEDQHKTLDKISESHCCK